MKRFIRKTIFFTTVFGAFWSFFCAASFTKEVSDYDGITKSQQESSSEFIVGMGYNEQTSYYKLSNIEYYHPEVIALGTSRVMQFKADYFSTGFYNAGGAVNNNYDEYQNFLANLNIDVRPKLIILGLDTWVFNDNWNRNASKTDKFYKIVKNRPDIRSILLVMMADYRDKKWTFGQLLDEEKNCLGFNGRIKKSGFLKDGSYYYGDNYRNPKAQKDYLFADTYSRIDTGAYRFEYGETVDEESLMELNGLLDYCKQENIMVVAFIPPFAPSVYEKMQNSDRYGYMKDIYPKCEELFRQYNYEVYDLQNPSILGCADDYYIDGFHGGDIVYGKIIKHMLANGSIINQYIDEVELERMIKQAYSHQVFEDPDTI